MNLRALRTLALVILGFASQAIAGLEVISANYGTQAANRDVRGIIAAYIRHNTLSFPVSARAMGGDPTRGRSDFLFIVYRANGREFHDVVSEGQTFTFQGVPQVRPAAPFLGLPFLRPASPDTAPLTIVNRSHGNVRLYSVDRYQHWVWVADIPDTQTIAVTSLLGQRWVATDDSDRVLVRTRVTRGEMPMIIEPPGPPPAPGTQRGEEAWVRFENASFNPLYLYNLDPAGRWNWMATIEPGGGYSASTHVGETWIATNIANRVVRQTVVTPGLSRVKLQ